MPKFSKVSLDRLATVDRKLYDICSDAILLTDFAVIVGYRNKEDQDKACAEGKSKTPWPTSKHNLSPSQAIDLAPWPIDWNDLEKFKQLNRIMQQCAAKRDIKIHWGGEFKTISDFDHWELIL